MSAFAVPPEAKIFHPSAMSAWANSTTPSFLKTEMSAFFWILFMAVSFCLLLWFVAFRRRDVIMEKNIDQELPLNHVGDSRC